MKCQKYNFTDLLLPQLVKLLNPIPARVLENHEKVLDHAILNMLKVLQNFK